MIDDDLWQSEVVPIPEPGTIYFPRSVIVASMDVLGERIPDLALVPRSVKLMRKSHKHPGELQVEIDQAEFPFDARAVDGGHLSLFAGDASGQEADIDDLKVDENYRFVGFLDVDEENFGDGNPTVKLTAYDYSHPLRRQKLRKDDVPKYSDSFADAIRKIINSSPMVRDQLSVTITSALTAVRLGELVANGHGNDPVTFSSADVTAWGAIEELAALSARSAIVHLDQLIIRSPEELYGPVLGTDDQNAPAAVFVFDAHNANVSKLRRRRTFSYQRRGIKVVARNPTDRRRLVAIYPSEQELQAIKRLPKTMTARGRAQDAVKAAKPAGHGGGHATPKAKSAKVIDALDREIVYWRGIQTQAALDAVAKAAYLEMAAQESEITLETPIWDSTVLNLFNGRRVDVHCAPQLQSLLRSVSESAGVDFLVDRLAVDRETAGTMVRIANGILPSRYYVDSVSPDWSHNGKPSVSITLRNLVDLKVTSDGRVVTKKGAVL